jgi:flagellar capping protein FliD
MSTISLGGVSTGIDTATLISQLMAVEKKRYTSYETKKTAATSKLDLVNTVDTKLAALKTSASALADAQTISAFKVTSSDTDILTASASSSASEGSHSIDINQLATAGRYVHNAGLEYAEDYVGKGNFIYSYNNVESVIATTDTTTLEELAGLINNDANNPGVTASLLNYGDTYHLVLSGNSAGSDYAVKLNSSNTELWKSASALKTGGDNAAESTKLTDLDAFDGTLKGDEGIRIQGTQHDGTVVDYDFAFNGNMKVSHLLNEIETAFGNTVSATLDNGVIKVTDNTSGVSQMTISLTYDAGDEPTSSSMSLPTLSQTTRGGSITMDPETGLGQIFSPESFTQTQPAQDSQFTIDGYPSSGYITRSSNTISDVIPGVTIDLQNIGTAKVTVTRDSSAIKTKVQALVDQYNTITQLIKDNSGYDAATKVAGILMGDSTISAIKEAIRNPFTVQAAGFIQSSDTFANPASIGLTMDAKGVLSLNETTFDEALAKNPTAVLSLIDADKAGSSDSSYIQFYGASSKYTTAGTYDVKVHVDETTNQITEAWLRLSGESTWRAATWVDNVVMGSNSSDANGNPSHPEKGLQLTVDLTQTGDVTAKVRIKEGFAGTLTSNLETILKGTTGSINVEEKYIQLNISDLQTKMDNEQKRLDKMEERLKEKYARMEATITKIQQQLNSITSSS